MNREQLAHIVRAAARIAIEADIAFRDDPDGIKADRVDGAIGELSSFHETYGYYAQGVSITGREKDVEFAEVLIAAGMVDPALLEARAATIDRPGAVVNRVTDSIRRCARNAAARPGSAAGRRLSSDSEVPPAVGPADCQRIANGAARNGWSRHGTRRTAAAFAHGCILGSWVGSAYTRGQPRSTASGRSS